MLANVWCYEQWRIKRTNIMNKDEEIKQLKATIKEQSEQLRLHSVSNRILLNVKLLKL